MRELRRAALALLALLAACGGADLTLPGSGDPVGLSIVSGDGQSATVGEAVSEPLVVAVTNSDGGPVPGAVVVFHFSDDPPQAVLDPSSSPTDSSGRASATVTPGTRPGDQPIDAQVATPGRDLQVRFRLTAVAKAPPPRDGGQGGNGGSAGPPPSGGNDGQGGGGGDGSG